MIYQKKHYTFQEQVEKLKSRGITGEDEQILLALKRIGYYRLSGYTFAFFNNEGFSDFLNINRILEVYEFDMDLRNVLFGAIEQIEVYFRTHISYILSSNFKAFGYLSKEAYPNLSTKRYAELLSKCIRLYERSSEQFIQHFKEKYGSEHEFPPIWILVNILEMGTLLTMFRGLNTDYKRQLAEPFGIHYTVLESWLVAIHVLRNICAHHGRLWNRRIGVTPKLPKNLSEEEPYNKINDYQLSAHLFIVRKLLETINPSCSSLKKLEELECNSLLNMLS